MRAMLCQWINRDAFASYRTFVIMVILGMLAAVSIGQEKDQNGVIKRPQKAPTSVSTESSLRPILNILDRAKLSGSLEVSGSCDSFAYPGFPELPQLRTPVTSSDTPLHSLRKLFVNDSKMHVTQDSDGTIRMTESNVPRDFLNLKIDHISFASQVYSANAAVRYVLSSPEVELFMKSGGINFPFSGGVASGIIGPGSPTSPHISGSIENLTVSGAMDRILKTFPGIWIYEDCPGMTQEIVLSTSSFTRCKIPSTEQSLNEPRPNNNMDARPTDRTKQILQRCKQQLIVGHRLETVSVSQLVLAFRA